MQEKKQYKAKNKEEKKERDQERPKTTEESKDGGQRGGRGRGRGGKGEGRGGKGDNRPQTAKAGDATNNREKQNEAKQDDRQGNPKRNQNNNREDKNSWIYKYHHIERLEYPKTTFTKDTEIPAMPTKEEKLKEPSKADFEREMAIEDKKIQEKRDKLHDLRKKRREIIDGGKMSGSNMTYRESLSQKISELKQVNVRKRKINDQLKEISDQINSLQTEKRMLSKDMHKSYHSVEEVKEGLRDLEYRLKVQTNSGQEERKIVKEIDQLQKSIPLAERFSQIQPQVDQLMAEKKTVYASLSEVKKEVQGHEVEIEKIRKEIEKLKEGQTDTKEQANEVSKVIEAIDQELQEIYSLKDKKREEYWKGRYDFKVQQNHIAMIDWMQRQKEKAIEKEGEHEERKKAVEEELKNLEHPFEKEITTCEQLISFLHQLKIRAGLEQESEQVAIETQKNFLAEQGRANIQRKLQDGQIQASDSKAEREAAAMIQVGGKKKKGKKQKTVTEYEDAFNIDFVVVQKFSKIDVNPPTEPSELDERIKEVQKKKQWYEDNGEEKHKEMMEQIKNEYEEAEKERREAEEQEEKERQANARGGYGRGRGGTYGRGGSRGRGGRGRGGYQSRVKNEFEGSDEEGVYDTRPSKPVKQKQKAEDLEINDNNYPSLGDL